MEEHGLIERVRVPDDRRVVLVRPADGRPAGAVRDRDARKRDAMRAVLGHLSAAERPIVLAALRSLRRALSAEVESSRRPPAPLRRRGELDPPTSQPQRRKVTHGIVPERRPPDPVGRGGSRARAEPQRAKLEILGAVLLGMFLSALDQTIVGPVLPKIVGELNGSDYYTWAVTIYLLTSTVTVPIYGKLSDLYGRKPILMVGITLFLVGSALSGLSQEMWQLVLFRGIQGLGAGALFPIALAVIGDLFTPGRARQVPGPLRPRVRRRVPRSARLIGGFLTDTFSWHCDLLRQPARSALIALARDLAAAAEHQARRARRQDRLRSASSP